MKIAFFSIYLNHHQAIVADEFYKLLGDDYAFVELRKCLDNKGSTENFSLRPYLIQAWNSPEDYKKAMHLASTYDVCVFAGIESLPFEKKRLKRDGLTFEMGERSLKRGWLNLLSPRLLLTQWYYHISFYKKNIYKLCCSAYAPNDLYKLHSFVGRCYKWGYFTKVDDDFEVEAPLQGASTLEITPLMWCARFLKLKHPELPVQLAHRLKEKGYRFHIDMFGGGEELDNTKSLIAKHCVEDCVTLRGNLPNEEILKEMRNHSIFLFTSDRNEGWGAVLNEAMSNGCAVVASDKIGSAPYLIENGRNGLLFYSESIDSLYDKVTFLIDNRYERMQIAYNAYNTMQSLWSPEVAAKRFIMLSDTMFHERQGAHRLFDDGPCSIAIPM